MTEYHEITRRALLVASLALLLIAQTAAADSRLADLLGAIDIQDRRAEILLDRQGVIGSAVSVDEQGRAVIRLYLSQESVSGLPTLLEGLDVVPVFIGEVSALRYRQPPVVEETASPPNSNPSSRWDRPVPIGVSVGHTAVSAGTLGCRVQSGCHKYALSNNHVFADEGVALLDDAVVQPGPFDGGTYPDDFLGTLYDYEPIDFSTSPATRNYMDAAIVLVNTSTMGNSTLVTGYGTPKSETVAAYVGMPVQKFGRTTGLTTGTVVALNATVDVAYDAGTARFREQIIIEDGSFSTFGDSGALVVVNGGADDRKPVGLIFAAGDTVSVANPIDPILERFAVDMDGE